MTLNCFGCGAQVVLPYTDSTKSEVSITPLGSWTSPPFLCPNCSQRAQDERNLGEDHDAF